MSTKTTPPSAKPKKKGPMANAFDRIKALEEKANQPHTCKVARLVHPQSRQYTGRVTMPSPGIALPAGIAFHGYVSVRMTDDVIDDQFVPPSEEDVMVLLRQKADQENPGFIDVELADISVLPEGWHKEPSLKEG